VFTRLLVRVVDLAQRQRVFTMKGSYSGPPMTRGALREKAISDQELTNPAHNS
jgi:hypothetical protein